MILPQFQLNKERLAGLPSAAKPVWTPRVLFAVLGMLIPWANVQAQDEAYAPVPLEEMVTPTIEVLLQEEPVDWIVLNTGLVLVVEPVYPRPDTLKKLEAERARLELEKSAARTADARLKWAEQMDKATRMEVFLPGEVVTEYRIKVADVAQIISHEDLMLRRVDELLDAGNIRRAYEVLVEVEKLVPGWEQAALRFERLLVVEADQKVKAGNPSAALALLDELALRNKDNAQLPEAYAAISDPLIADALAAGDYRQAHFHLNRLRRLAPRHPVGLKWVQQLSGQAATLLDEGQQLASTGNHREAAQKAMEAARIWELDGNERARYSQLAARFQTIRVGVRSFDNTPTVFPAERAGEARDRSLTEVHLFEPTGASDLTFYGSDYFERWDPADLGRRVVFTLKQTRPHWQSQPLLTANQVADTIAARIDPTSPVFDPRLTSFIRQFSVTSPTTIEIEFGRVPLSIEGLFNFPLYSLRADNNGAELPDEAPAADSAAEPQSAAGDADGLPPIASTRFRLIAQDEQTRTYGRRIPEPDGLNANQYHVAEIVEQQYETHEQIIQAMNRGEIDVVTRIKPWEIDAFAGADRFFVRQYALPTAYAILMNPHSDKVRSTTLRRAISNAIDREGILQHVVLRSDDPRHGRATGAVWPTKSYATNPLVQPPEYDLRLAFALAESARYVATQQEIAAAKARGAELPEDFQGQLPTLRMVCENEDEILAAAEQMQKYWQRIGISIEIIPGDRPGEPLKDDEWDLMFRSIRMEEPLLELWPLMIAEPTTLTEPLTSFPAWLRQELINLDYAASFRDAQIRLFDIQKHLADQAFVIPLWEVDEYIAFRKSISGFDDEQVRPYQSVEEWSIRP